MDSAPHIITRLPDELLAMVFVEWLEDDDSIFYEYQAAFFLAAVSRRWRRVAISTPQLWCYVKIYLPHVTLESQDLWVDYLRTCLLRSGSINLELEVMGTLQVIEGLSNFWDTLRICFSHSRAVELELRMDEPPMPDGFLRCFTQDMPYLEYFYSNCDDDTSFEVPLSFSIFNAAPRLWRIRTLGIGPTWSSNSIFPDVTWASIKSDNIGITAFVELLQSLPNIEDLEVRTAFLSATDAPTNLSSALHCTTLRKLVYHSDGFDEAIARSMDFPNLRSAALQFCDRGLATPAAVAALLGHAFRAVRKLTLYNCDCMGPGLLDGPRLIPRLRSLCVMGRTIESQNFLEELCRPDAAGDWPCPRLQHISLSSWDVTTSAGRGLALHVAAARGPCALPDCLPPRMLQTVRVTAAYRIDRPSPEADEKSLQRALDRLISADAESDGSEDSDVEDDSATE